ncbi:DUF4340 domain-containing protein [Singulisphaera rosea]
MKKHHTTIVLLTLFFTGLIVLWWADYAEIPTAEQLRRASGLVLPELNDVQAGEVRRVEVDQLAGKSEGTDATRHLVFERRGEGWQLIKPVDVAADPSRIEALVRNLKLLKRVPDAGTIVDPANQFGFDPAQAVIRAFGKDAKTLLATLEVGKAVRDRLYVRPAGQTGVEVVDGRPFQGISQPLADWRDKAVFNLPSFLVAGFSVSGPSRDLKAERLEGHWKLSSPIRALAEDSKVEEALGELTSLTVSEGTKGFVADDVRDLNPYGLEKDPMKVELVPPPGRGQPQTLLVGKAVSDKPEKFYAVRSDQNDVFVVDAKGFRELGLNPNALRSKKVTDFIPALADRIRIEAYNHVFDLARTTNGWELLRPTRERADAESIPGLLTKLSELETSEFFGEDKVSNPELDPPLLTLKVWQALPGKKPAPEPSPERTDAPRVDLKFGRHDALRKAAYARVEGDRTILVFPDAFLALLPKNEFAFRNRSVVSLSPSQVTQLSVARDGQTFTLVGGSASDPNRWRVTSPIEAPANDEAVTKALLILSHLTAERLVADSKTDGKPYGFDSPNMTVSWVVPDDKGQFVTKTLVVGAKFPGKEFWFAKATDVPYIFTVPDGAILPFHEEFRSRRVLSFAPKQVKGLTLRWADRTLAFAHSPTPRGGPGDWSPLSGTDVSGFDVSRIDTLASDLSRFQTRKFLQYKGAIPESSGLKAPRLTVEIQPAAPSAPIVLRIGNAFGEGEFQATTDTGADGAVFLISGTGWADLLKPEASASKSELPDDVFAPAPKAP